MKKYLILFISLLFAIQAYSQKRIESVGNYITVTDVPTGKVEIHSFREHVSHSKNISDKYTFFYGDKNQVIGITSGYDITNLVDNLDVAFADLATFEDWLHSHTGSKGGQDVSLQDQHTPVVELYISQFIQFVTIEVDTAVGDKVMTISSATPPVVGNLICLKEGVNFYQGIIIASVANSTNWDITLDSQLDFAFTVVGGCTERNINMAVDGSATPVEFVLSPSNLTAGTTWDITRIIGIILDSQAMDDGLFGALPKLTNGVLLRIENGVTNNLMNWKTNGEIRLRCFDALYDDKAPAGQYGFSFRKTYAGPSKVGVTLRIDVTGVIKIIIQDNLTGLDQFYIMAQGHVVEY